MSHPSLTSLEPPPVPRADAGPLLPVYSFVLVGSACAMWVYFRFAIAPFMVSGTAAMQQHWNPTFHHYVSLILYWQGDPGVANIAGIALLALLLVIFPRGRRFLSAYALILLSFFSLLFVADAIIGAMLLPNRGIIGW